jgi:hypothetical protein
VTEQRELRIGDAERTQAAAELGEHYAQGRLTTEEHNERLDRILEARTRTELAPIFADLPGSTYAVPASYPSARTPGVGHERAARSMPQPFGQPRARSGRRGLPGLIKVVLVVLALVFVVTNLPLILVGVVIWLLLTRGSPRFRSGAMHHRRC